MASTKRTSTTKKSRTNTGGGNAANNQGGNSGPGGITMKSAQLQRIDRQLQQWEQGVASMRSLISSLIGQTQHQKVTT